ncbi:P-type HAD superfamily ATPase [Candidatus Protofrankia californiensis]|uniref:P-type HAD superfamily ATPase n=1 Tax=Candidatus Protofrankia californiensis TaxID=1839754 RepID=A0A1C3P557_9ACTN|nr:P-type HAD superfamily ATPase [Candidatus Protofrankia californiensis]
MLGAPDVLLPPGDLVLVDADLLASQGLRVLLLGRAGMPVDAPGAPGEVTPAALLVIEQKIRDDAAETLRYFAAQDVELKIISGDSAVSVAAVATTLGLPGADQPVDARTLPDGTAPLAGRMAAASVFGRVVPEQKRAMVKALQAGGHTVAMTGDGVNDLLALKDADIGVAMGSGSPAARAVAQIVLLDNTFAALPHVVGEGRRVIGNIERVSVLFLTKTVYSVLLAILIGVAQIRFPFLPRHVTLIGWFTIGVPAFFLALAPNTERARPGFVPRVMRRAVPAGVVVAVASFVTCLLVRSGGEGTPEQDSTAVVITLVMIATWVLVVVARPYVWWKAALVAAMIGGFLLCLLLPVGQHVFEFDTSDTAAVAVAVACGAVGMALVELAWRFSFVDAGERRPHRDGGSRGPDGGSRVMASHR